VWRIGAAGGPRPQRREVGRLEEPVGSAGSLFASVAETRGESRLTPQLDAYIGVARLDAALPPGAAARERYPPEGMKGVNA